MKRAHFEIDGILMPPGTRYVVELELPKISYQIHLSTSVHVIHERQAAPSLFLSAAIHGGLEILSRVLYKKVVAKLKGTLVAVPVVNAYGLIRKKVLLTRARCLTRFN